MQEEETFLQRPGTRPARTGNDDAEHLLPAALEMELGATGNQSEAVKACKGTSWRDWPHQILYIMGNEVCERFSFYGMRAILVVYMTSNLDMDAPNAEAAFHIFTAVSYCLPLFGAWLADNVLGKYAVILYLSGFYCAGHGVLAIWESRLGLAVGLALISIGAGGIKPCVAALVGDQFDESSNHHLPSVFAMFYWCINLGSFSSMVLTPLLLKYLGPSMAFSVPGIFMALALGIFWAGRHMYILKDPEKEKPAGFLTVTWHCLRESLNRRPGEGFWLPAAEKFSVEDIDAAQAVTGLLGLFGCLSMFQALFDQHSSTWVVQAQTMNLSILGWEMPPSQMQALNPVLVMILIPLFEAVLYPAVSYALKVDLTPLRKMSTGMVLSGFSFVYIAGIQAVLDAGLRPSILWQTPAYLILTSSEVLVSATGLQFAYTQAPTTMKSTIMSLWLLTVFFGNILDALMTKIRLFSGLAFFLFFACLMFLVALLFMAASHRYKMRDYGSKKPSASVKVLESDDGQHNQLLGSQTINDCT